MQNCFELHPKSLKLMDHHLLGLVLGLGLGLELLKLVNR
jgi:hypothetical protein